MTRLADTSRVRPGICSVNPSYPGPLFGKGCPRASIYHLFSSIGMLTGVSDYEYTTGSGDDSITYRWYLAMFRLLHPILYLLPGAKANNGVWRTNLSGTFTSSQYISLEEPSNSHYQLYVPEGYGRDTFQLLPSNVMEALPDAPAIYDIETVDDRPSYYTQSRQDLTSPVTWRPLETIASGVLGSLIPVVGRYSDSCALVGTTGNAGYGPGTPVQVVPRGKRPWYGMDIPAFTAFAILLACMILTRFLRPSG